MPHYPDKVHSTGNRRVEDYERLLDCAVKNDNDEDLGSLFTFLIENQRWSQMQISYMIEKVLGEKAPEVQVYADALWDHYWEQVL